MAISRVGIGVLVGTALGAALALSGTLTRLGFPTATPAPAPSAPAAAPAHTVSAPGDPALDPSAHSRFAILAKQAAPGIVNVHTSRTVTQAPFQGGPLPDALRDLLRQQPGAPAPRSFTVPSLGS